MLLYLFIDEAFRLTNPMMDIVRSPAYFIISLDFGARIRIERESYWDKPFWSAACPPPEGRQVARDEWLLRIQPLISVYLIISIFITMLSGGLKPALLKDFLLHLFSSKQLVFLASLGKMEPEIVITR